MLSSIILVKALLYLSHVYKGTNQDTYGVSDWESYFWREKYQLNKIALCDIT